MRYFVLIIITLALVSCTRESESYRVMTYNIRYDNPNDGPDQWAHRKKQLCEQIKAQQLDVFGVQEALHHQLMYIDSSFVNYQYVGVGRDDGKTKGEYSAIFYNTDTFNVKDQGTFWLSDTPESISVGWDASMERICTYALFENVASKVQFWVFNAHFDHIGDMARLNSAKLIVEKIQQFNNNNLPVILMGDLNLTPESKPIVYLSELMNDTKTVSATPPTGMTGTYNSFKTDQAVNDRIDYIFTSKQNVEVMQYRVLSETHNGRYLSDHFAVVVEVQIQ